MMHIAKVLFACAVFSACVAVAHGQPAPAGPKKIIFAVDGLSYRAFQAARARGLFKRFDHSSQHIPVYPSMSNPSWTEILGTRQVFPALGNIRTIEAKYFDPDHMITHSDPRNVYTRQASFYNYTRALDYYFNPLAEPLMYFPQDRVLDFEIKQLEEEVYANFTQDTYVAYIAAVDAVAHTQVDRLFPLLAKLDLLFERILRHYEEANTRVDAWLVSDHGNASRFDEGTAENYLATTTLQAAAEAVGLVIREGRLTQANEIAIPILALGNYAQVYFYDLSRREAFAKAALDTNPLVQLVTYVEYPEPSRRTIHVLGTGAQRATLEWRGTGKTLEYLYRPSSGNPLAVPESLLNRWVTDADAFRALAAGIYPDAFRRLVESADKQVENTPDLIVNLGDGAVFDGPLSKIVKMVRTHGSLTRDASMGLLASTATSLPPHVRSSDVLAIAGIDPHALHARVHDLTPGHELERAQRARDAGANPTLDTQSSRQGPDLLFRRQYNALDASIDIVAEHEAIALYQEGLAVAKDLLEKSRDGSSKQSAREAFEKLKQFDPIDIARNIDALVALVEDLRRSETDSDSVMAEVERRLEKTPGFLPLVEASRALQVEEAAGDNEAFTRWIDLIRRSVMKLWTLPIFINRALTFQEFDRVPDPRDAGFAFDWLSAVRQETARQAERAPLVAAQLFEEIFKERKALHTLAPATVPLYYSPERAAADEITIVFIPGIYNEYFGTEIFARAIRSIREHLGTRVLYLDVDGRCGSEVNADDILDHLRLDTRRRLERGFPAPAYLILGYSKGSVDALHAFLKDPQFVRNQVRGLVSVAGPLRGSRVLENADLPLALNTRAVAKALPEACRTQTASGTLHPRNMAEFWRNHTASLAGLTRYFSLSLVADADEAHPWMKLTKALARFGEPNDGVVSVTSSKFPDDLKAIDLGTLRGDHLAAIAASQFPQEALLEATVLTLSELGVYEQPNRERWHQRVASLADPLIFEHHKAQVLKLVGAGSDPTLAVQPLTCDDFAGNGRLPLGDIRRRLKGTSYELKPMDVRCLGASRTAEVVISVSRPPIYRPFGKPGVYRSEVKTLNDFVELVLRRGTRSGGPFEPRPSLDTSGFPRSTRPSGPRPAGTLTHDENDVIDLRKLPTQLAGVRITPMSTTDFPQGVSIVFDHLSTRDFRKEFGFRWESRTPGGMDDNLVAGYAPVLEKSAETPFVAMRLKSLNNNIRLTTLAYRFKPLEFPRVNAQFKVVKAVPGADPAKGAGNLNDSAFQIWFMLRESNSKAVRMFGYYWADERSRGLRPVGSIVEAGWSRRNFLVFTLPEAYLMAIGGGRERLSQWQSIDRNLAEDLAKAFPNVDPKALEVVGITIQADTDSLKADSEAWFRQLSIQPASAPGPPPSAGR